MNLKETETEKNLLKAFAGESQARNCYEFYAKVTKKEGFEQIAAIFQQTADQEKQHAKRFFKFLEGGMVKLQLHFLPELSELRKKILKWLLMANTKNGLIYIHILPK